MGFGFGFGFGFGSGLGLGLGLGVPHAALGEARRSVEPGQGWGQG